MGENNKALVKHFISTLGTGGYTEGDYVCERGRCRTAFVQEASLKLGLESQVDRITVCLTDEAEATNWIGRINSSGEREKGLKAILEEQYGKEKIEIIKMNKGDSTKATDETFDRIYRSIQENEEIYFDITHGFRYFPMLVLTVLEYAKVTKNITVGGIYYGEFVRPENGEPVDWPWYDLTYYSDILSWSNAADAFVRYGHSNQINDLMHKLAARDRLKYQELNKLVQSLNNITQCIDVGRGKNGGNKGNSIEAAYIQYKEQYEKFDKKDFADVKPLEILMEKIDQKVDVLKVDSNLSTGLSVVRWSLENDMIQQGYTALEETIKTYVCGLVQVDDTTKLYRDDFVKSIITKLKIENQGRKKAEGEDERERWYQAWLEEMNRKNGFKNFYNKNEEHEQTEKKIKRMGKRLIRVIPYEVVQISSAVSEKRNDINHFGFNESPVKYIRFKTELEKRYNELLKIIQENPIPERICESQGEETEND